VLPSRLKDRADVGDRGHSLAPCARLGWDRPSKGPEAAAEEREHGVDEGGEVLRRRSVGSRVEGLEGGDEGGGDQPRAQVVGGGVQVSSDGGRDEPLDLGQPRALPALQRRVAADDRYAPEVKLVLFQGQDEATEGV
jgi:hypothetical protein